MLRSGSITSTWLPRTARGWKATTSSAISHASVSPAYAGMKGRADHRRPGGARFPRVRGDGRVIDTRIEVQNGFPPPARGWKDRRPRSASAFGFSPARAGIEGRRVAGWPDSIGFPPARGWKELGLPRERAISVSPAYAGMKGHQAARAASHECFPRIRGDGRSWRSPLPPPPQFPPAYAGMKGNEQLPFSHKSRFPRIRGDGRQTAVHRARHSRFPPHTRGWKELTSGMQRQDLVSPAYAGMEGRWSALLLAPIRFPRIRGDGR